MFPDVPANFFAYNEISYLVGHNIIGGFPGGLFQPNANTTRAQFSKMIVLAFGLPLLNPATPSYSDVPTNYWAYRYIESARTASVINGYDAVTCQVSGVVGPCFLPSKSITRAELVKIVVKVKAYPANCPSQIFPDVPTNHWAYCAVSTAQNKGVISGYPGNPAIFGPNQAITRAELSVVLYRALVTALHR